MLRTMADVILCQGLAATDRAMLVTATDQETMIVRSSSHDSDFDVAFFLQTSSAIMHEFDRPEYPWMHEQDDFMQEEPDEEEPGVALMVGH